MSLTWSPLYVAAPITTLDLSLPTGESIPIEQRAASEVTQFFGRQLAPDNIAVHNPAFEVTPAQNMAPLSPSAAWPAPRTSYL